ncbi:synaptonemal complex central element protein 1 isoform X2 [Astyanax mexicanus]|uniref:synaptonemal complex central element protein 1 isoform X2 n=1 Tax=Astyanax mexicanus TaxID=7994 RepID=UPI000440AD6C|nr:synaptonemal complex central element protein 1 isoform X2 [Astyanax mexicanus]
MTIKLVSDNEPKIEELLKKLKKLQQAKLDLEEDVKEAYSLKNTLHDEEDALSIEVLKLQEMLNEKNETCRSLQLKCEDLEQESQRQFELKQQKEELAGQYGCQIQETKLRHRKIRMKFENHLQQLMGQHKNLYTVFTPERLPTEIQSAEYATQQLLKAEQQMLEQVAHLQEQLNKAQATDSVKRMHDELFTKILHS